MSVAVLHICIGMTSTCAAWWQELREARAEAELLRELARLEAEVSPLRGLLC